MNSQESIYIARTDLRFNGNFDEIIETQITDKDTIINLGFGLELLFENNRLVKVFEYFQKSNTIFKKVRQLELDEYNYSIPRYKLNRILKYEESLNGLHQIGGEFPEDFFEPDNNCKAPFQYLGFINNEDVNFNWLPFKLHLTCPIYLGFEELFLDYSNESKPVILNKEEVESLSSNFNEINKDSYISFELVRFNLINDVRYSLNVNSGIPNWMQSLYIPSCPKTGVKMKFLCQIYKGSKMKNSNIRPENDYNKSLFNNLNFYGGDLFVFFEPTSKIVCYFLQHT
ncbi:MAG: hypothetical protein RLZZ175_2162 [Bacteroidota bacterium]|jgi:hypothetical protein